MESRDRLIESQLPLVRALARRMARPGDDVDDLEQAGAIGLIQAVDRFDDTRGCALGTFAAPNIVWEMSRQLGDARVPLRVPRRIREQRRALAVAERELAAARGRAPTRAELAAATGLPRDEVERTLAIDALRMPVALASPEGEDADAGGGDFREAAEDRVMVAGALRVLPPRERRILGMRFALDLTQDEIARRVGVSQVQVSRLIRAALARLQEVLGDDRGLARPAPTPYIAANGRRRTEEARR
jgi:RNA polymerase sigma-B factor